MSSESLTPVSPQEAAEQYMDHRRSELREQTLEAHYYRLKQFWEWCERDGLDNLNDITLKDIDRYTQYRIEELGNAIATVRGDLATVRVYLEFCARIDGVPIGFSEKIDVPIVEGRDGVDETSLTADRAERVFEHLGQFEYATIEHAMLAVAWHTGCRVGALRGLDLDDYRPAATVPHLVFRHRPPLTPLKNGEYGERSVDLGAPVIDILDDYIEVNRRTRTEDNGRKPLFKTRGGRPTRSTIRGKFYRVTRPCISGPCPHDRDPAECPAVQGTSQESRCPSSRSPHAIRTGAITKMRADGVSMNTVSARVDAAWDVVDMHYDMSTWSS